MNEGIYVWDGLCHVICIQYNTLTLKLYISNMLLTPNCTVLYCNLPILCMCLPTYLPTCLSTLQITSELGLNEIRDRVWNIIPCSAKTGEGLQDGMEWIVEQINHSEVSEEGRKEGGKWVGQKVTKKRLKKCRKVIKVTKTTKIVVKGIKRTNKQMTQVCVCMLVVRK